MKIDVRASARRAVDRCRALRLSDLRRLPDRPVVCTFLLGVVFTAFQMWWNIRHRHLGDFNVDEEGGLAAAFRFHRSVDLDPRPLLTQVFSTWNGPLVPLLAIPGLIIGPRSVYSAMLVQPVLVVVAGCAAAGIVNAMGHRRAALLTGVTMILIPGSVLSSRSYQYSIGVAAFFALALWALVTSDRGRNRWRTIGFGAATGLMTLCRTMAASFVPGLGLAALVILVWHRRAIVNALLAAVAAFAVAGPWWIVEWKPITDYLALNAYGPRAHYWGTVAFSNRVDDHIRFFEADFGYLVPIATRAMGFVALGAVIWMVRRRRERAWRGSARILLAVWVAGLAGQIALLSTPNFAVFFAYPLDVAFIVGVIGLLAGLPPHGARRHWQWWKEAFSAITVCFLVGSFVVSLTMIESERPTGGWRSLFTGDYAAGLQSGNIDADPRLLSTDSAVRKQAADEWWRTLVVFTDQIDRLGRALDGPLLETVVGEVHLLNANTILLAQEVTGKGFQGVEVVNTLEPPDDQLRHDVTPLAGGIPRVLVMINGRSLGFPNGRGMSRLLTIALQRGWVPGAPIPLPDGGNVTVMTHPESLPS